MEPLRIGCVVMASGDSVRFGGDKLLAPYLGKPLICHALRALPKGLEAVVVTRQGEVFALAKAMGFECVLHQLPEQSDTIRLGMAYMVDADGCLFMVADQPLLRTGTIIRMMDAFREKPSAIVRARFAGRWGNPVLFPRALFAELSALEPGDTGGAVIKRHPDLLIPVEAESALELEDVDTPEQLRLLEEFGRAQE